MSTKRKITPTLTLAQLACFFFEWFNALLVCIKKINNIPGYNSTKTNMSVNIIH